MFWIYLIHQKLLTDKSNQTEPDKLRKKGFVEQREFKSGMKHVSKTLVALLAPRFLTEPLPKRALDDQCFVVGV